jgi:hypothetical protein
MTTMMDRAIHAVRTWLGLTNASGMHLTPGQCPVPIPAEVPARRRAAPAARSNAPGLGPVVKG